MKFEKTKFLNVIICKPDIYFDKRGFFKVVFRNDKFLEFLGYKVDFCQENESVSNYGVLRGLHYQANPNQQSKLIRVTKGKILDVIVDLRSNSKTYGEHFSIILSSKNHKTLFIPKGFAHGYVVLSNSATVSYRVDNYYDMQSEKGIIYNDKTLKIDWMLNVDDLIISKKDKLLPKFSNSEDE